MLIFTKISELNQCLDTHRSAGKSIGFVPTMGALHPGHLSLIKASKEAADITVCSIFVNPTQFNDKSDLERYPRTPKSDISLLEESNCDILFMPEVDEMYPVPDNRKFDFGPLDKILDGAHRPGHFNGVAQIVSRLFSIVKPNKAFFGIKDYQQLLIVKALVLQLDLNIEIVGCEISRENDGLAMSSRNTLLNANERKAASVIPLLMKHAKLMKQSGNSANDIERHVMEELKKNPIYKLDYFKICNPNDLTELQTINKDTPAVALIACFVGKIRLIDNCEL